MCRKERSEVATLGLYIHVPFCATKCRYCDFASYVGQDVRFTAYAQSVQREIAEAALRWPGREVGTIYIGGGTPTVWPSRCLSLVMDACRSSFAVQRDAEITCEANPGSADLRRLGDLLRLGVNRLSLGVQSLNDGELQLLGRSHTAVEALAAFAAARAAGFANINLDLIFGLPRQQLVDWQRTVEQTVALTPDHLSLYVLSLEEGTPLAKDVAAGDLPRPDPDTAADFYDRASELLTEAGFAQYEIANWARQAGEAESLNPRLACRHNLGYWHNQEYLGFGAAAHSSMGGRRWWNVRQPEEYLARMLGNAAPVQESEEIDEQLAMVETMILGLRLVREGVSYTSFSQRFGRSLVEVYGSEIAFLEDAGLLEILPDRIRLSRRGRLLGNEVFVRFLPS